MRVGFFSGQPLRMNLASVSFRFANAASFPIRRRPLSTRSRYGEAEVEMHVDAISADERVVLLDDLLATGGTSAAAAVLIRNAGGHLLEAQFLIELEFLQGRKRLEPTPVTSFLKY